ncbi:hypothetical protein ACWC5C_38625 [Streptomyces sp. NPDC001700]
MAPNSPHVVEAGQLYVACTGSRIVRVLDDYTTGSADVPVEDAETLLPLRPEPLRLFHASPRTSAGRFRRIGYALIGAIPPYDGRVSTIYSPAHAARRLPVSSRWWLACGTDTDRTSRHLPQDTPVACPRCQDALAP